MHKLSALLVFLIPLFGCFTTALADDIVVLKNGRQFTTSEYWKENNQVKFYFHGGIIGIPQSNVREVKKVVTPHEPAEETTTEAPTATAAGQEPTTTAATEPVAAVEKPAENKPAETQQPAVIIDDTYYREKKTDLIAQKNKVKETLATAGRRMDSRTQDRATKELQVIDRQLRELALELMAKTPDHQLPSWWSWIK